MVLRFPSVLLVSAVGCLGLLGVACGDDGPAASPFAEEEVDAILIGPDSQLGHGEMTGTGATDDRYAKADVTRNGANYYFMANGWGPGFESQRVSWSGTSFIVETMQGTVGSNWQPASYPTVFCGAYSDSESGPCGLPAEIAALTSLRTGWWWVPNGNAGEYNAAYDIWLANGPDRADFSGYFMVWYRMPRGQYPAGVASEYVSVTDIPGKWSIYSGTVNGRPIINYVRSVDRDTEALEFDVLDFIRDAESRGLEVPGTHILSVAVGFEIWNGPINNLATKDFYVEVE